MTAGESTVVKIEQSLLSLYAALTQQAERITNTSVWQAVGSGAALREVREEAGQEEGPAIKINPSTSSDSVC